MGNLSGMNFLQKIKSTLGRRFLEYMGKFRFSDVTWCFNLTRGILRHYKFWEFSSKNTNRVVVYMTDKTVISGLADRIKSMVFGYALALENGREFCLYHDKGFRLEEYLEPNEVDWRCEPADISWGLNKVAFLFYSREWPELKYRKKEYHVYQSEDIIADFMPEHLRAKYTYHDLFWRLFKLSPRLDTLLQQTLQENALREDEYVAVHARFINFFEHFENIEGLGKVASTEDEKQQMIQRVHATIEQIRIQSGANCVLLFSDSNYFLNVQHPEYVRILPGSIGHIAHQSGNTSVADKTFVDLLTISRAKEVYSLIGDGLYESGFSKTGAAIGGKKFVRVEVKE